MKGVLGMVLNFFKRCMLYLISVILTIIMLFVCVINICKGKRLGEYVPYC